MKGHAMRIRLTDEQAAIVKHRMMAGKGQSEEEVLDDALGRLIEDEIIESYNQEELKASLRDARAALDRGEGVPWDVDDFIARGEERLAARRPPKQDA